MKKNILYSVLISYSMLCLSGCYPTGDKKVNEDKVSDYVSEAVGSHENIPSEGTASASEQASEAPEQSRQVNIDLKNVKASLTLPTYDTDSMKQFSVRMREWDDAVIKETFLSGEEFIQHPDSDSDDYDNVKTHSYSTANEEKFLVYEPGRIWYNNTAKMREYSYSAIESIFFNFDGQEVFDPVEFDDFSIAQAKNVVESYLDKLDIDNLGEPLVYAVTAEDANSYIAGSMPPTDKHSNPLKTWSDEQQCYFLYYPFNCNGADFPIPREHYISAIVTKDELIELSCDNLCDTSTVEENKSLNAKYSAEKALNIIIDKYEKMIIDNPVYITDCKLTYIRREGSKELLQKYTPAWEITYKLDYFEIGTKKAQKKSQFYVDVQTGEIL